MLKCIFSHCIDVVAEAKIYNISGIYHYCGNSDDSGSAFADFAVLLASGLTVSASKQREVLSRCYPELCKHWCKY